MCESTRQTRHDLEAHVRNVICITMLGYPAIRGKKIQR
jgi:hypothetical protein